MIEVLPYRQENSPMPLDSAMAVELLEGGITMPEDVKTWLRHGPEVPDPAVEFPEGIEIGKTQAVLDKLTRLQEEGKIVAALQDGVDRTEGTYVHTWVPAADETPAEFFIKTMMPASTDHRLFLSTRPSDTLEVAETLVGLAVERSVPIYSKYIQQGLINHTYRQVNDQIDQIVIYLGPDNWQEGLAITTEAAGDKLTDRPIPYSVHQLAPGLGYIPEMLDDSANSKTTPFQAIRDQIILAMAHAVLRATAKTTEDADLSIALATMNARRASAFLTDTSLQHFGLLIRNRYAQASDEQKRQIQEGLATAFDGFSQVMGYQSPSLRANRNSLLNSDLDIPPVSASVDPSSFHIPSIPPLR